jgi:Protein of unknown function (DUF3540)
VEAATTAQVLRKENTVSNTARRLATTDLPLAGDYLGPAEVVGLGPPLAVRLPSGAVVDAAMALAVPYEPAMADEVLVIGKGEGHYVIGVLHGRGRVSLALEGDVDLHATNGKLRLRGDAGVELLGPELQVRTGRVEVIAGAVIQRFASLTQRVAKLLSVRAGEAHTVVEGAQVTQAESAAILTEGTMTLNGKQIHLG